MQVRRRMRSRSWKIVHSELGRSLIIIEIEGPFVLNIRSQNCKAERFYFSDSRFS